MMVLIIWILNQFLGMVMNIFYDEIEGRENNIWKFVD